MRIEYLKADAGSDKLLRSFRNGIVSLGKFDGVHRGHACIFQRMKELASARGLPAVAVSFDRQPNSILRPESVSVSLCTFYRKAELLDKLKLDVLVQLETNQKLLEFSPEEFFRIFFVEKIQANTIVEGTNFSFGCNRQGNAEKLQSLGRHFGIQTQIVPPLLDDGREISSSRIRSLLAEGNVEHANALLTENYRITGHISHGEGRGRHLGFPTANLADIRTLLPAQGVYACSCRVDNRTYPAAVHIGSNPTFEQDQMKLEAYLVGFQGNLYEQKLNVDFHARLRGSIKFESAEQLVEQMNRDVNKTVEIFERLPPP